MSRPLAATSVARRIVGEEDVAMEVAKAAKVFVRAAGGIWPCREYNVTSGGRMDGRIYK
jgi:hypothetical protein